MPTASLPPTLPPGIPPPPSTCAGSRAVRPPTTSPLGAFATAHRPLPMCWQLPVGPWISTICPTSTSALTTTRDGWCGPLTARTSLSSSIRPICPTWSTRPTTCWPRWTTLASIRSCCTSMPCWAAIPRSKRSRLPSIQSAFIRWPPLMSGAWLANSMLSSPRLSPPLSSTACMPSSSTRPTPTTIAPIRGTGST